MSTFQKVKRLSLKTIRAKVTATGQTDKETEKQRNRETNRETDIENYNVDKTLK